MNALCEQLGNALNVSELEFTLPIKADGAQLSLVWNRQQGVMLYVNSARCVEDIPRQLIRGLFYNFCFPKEDP